MKARDIDVRKGADDPTWTVRVGVDVYEMNERATAPNGVCMYIGRYAEGEHFDSSPSAPLVMQGVDSRPQCHDVPLAIACMIGVLAAEDLADSPA